MALGYSFKPVRRKKTPVMGLSNAPRPKKPPKRPPSGSYDPILDAQERAGDRGIQDLILDTETARERGLEDFTSNKQALTTGRDRTLADILTQENDVKLGYQRLGRQQAEQQRTSGVLSQGLAAKAAQIRAGNQAHDLAPLATARARANEDFTTQSGLMQRQYDRTYGPAGDLTTQLTRAQRENVFLGQDIAAQRAYQAAQGGYVPPGKNKGKGKQGPKGKGGKRFRLKPVAQRPGPAMGLGSQTGGARAPF